jgi:predicted GNAT family N-acyltransferase
MCAWINTLTSTFSYNRHISYLDDEPHASFHLLLRLLPSLEPIGTVRLIDLSPTKKKLGRLCVLKEYRSFKFGKDLILASHKAIVDRAQAAGIVEKLEISLHSQLYVKGLYAK